MRGSPFVAASFAVLLLWRGAANKCMATPEVIINLYARPPVWRRRRVALLLRAQILGDLAG
jgi:hypothetical protein